MATPIKHAYWCFYLEGRRERLLRTDIDLSKILADMKKNGTSLRDTLYAACQAAGAPMDAGKIKRVWLAEHDEDIGKAGGDTDEAFKAWREGRIDELAYALEIDLVDVMADELGVDDEEEDDDDDDDDEDGEEDDEPSH